LLESEVDTLRARRQLVIGLGEERRLGQLKIGVQDAERRAALMEKEMENMQKRWEGKVEVVRKAIEQENKDH
jgi:altronate dehydratase